MGENLVVYNVDANNTDDAIPQKFGNVPFEAVDRKWKTIAKFSWKTGASLPVCEARSVLFAVKHALRSPESFGKRHVILSDSLTATCAISRGRSSGFQLRHVCCQIGALALATGSYFSVRWIPSEWNPADNPSRNVWTPSMPQRFLGQCHLPAAAVERATAGGGGRPQTARRWSENPR